MIGMVSGRVRSIDPPILVVAVGGIGWELEAPASLLEEIQEDDEIELAVRTVLRQESITLYGFRDRMERELFDLLLRVQGVGPGLALSVIGVLGVDGCYQAVADEDLDALVTVPGVGEKTARRILLDMGTAARRKGVAPRTMAIRSEVRQGLLALGFRPVEFEPVLSRLPDDLDVATGMRLALRELRP